MRGALRFSPLLLALAHCGRGTPARVSAASASGEADSAPQAVAAEAGAAMDPLEASAWALAKDGDDEDRMRLADRVGCSGLRERVDDPGLRMTAIRAMAYCSDFGELPWLAEVAATGGDEEAGAALEAILEEAASPRRATDPEDAEELGAGCGTLLSLARAPDRPRSRRAKAVSALRMLVDRGCVKAGDIPKDVDAK